MFIITRSRKLVVAVLVCFSVFSFIPALSAKTEMNLHEGFHSIKWGANISEVHGLKLLNDDGTDAAYWRPNDYTQFGSAVLSHTAYIFEHGRFNGIIIQAKGATQWEEMNKTISKTFGIPDRNKKGEYYWIDRKFKFITLSRDEKWKSTLYMNYILTD